MAGAPATSALEGCAAKGRKVPKVVECATHGCLEHWLKHCSQRSSVCRRSFNGKYPPRAPFERVS